MRCVVMVKFLPGGSLSAEEFFARLNAQWSWLEETGNTIAGKPGSDKRHNINSPRAALCIADFDSIQQLAIDLAIMPGAGISNVEILQTSEDSGSELSLGVTHGR